MQNWKKLAGFLLALTVMAGMLAGCSGSNESSEASSETDSNSSAVSSEAESDSDADVVSSEYDYGDGLNEKGGFAGVTALDYVTLPDYRSMEVPEDVSAVTDEDLTSELDSMLETYASGEQVTDRAVEDGDTISIDYVGSVDGVEFDGGNTNGTGTIVTIGVTSYIDDFLEQIIGHMPGDTFDINVTFPDPYENNTDLSGKDAVFVTTVNYILESQNPELTDEFVASHWEESDGWTTVEQMKDGVRQQMSEEASVSYLWNKVEEEAEISQVPQAVTDYHLKTLEHYYESVAAQYGMELEDFLSQYMGVSSIDELVEQNQDILDNNSRDSLILQALCEDMGFQVTDEMLDDFLTNQLSVSDLETIKSYYGIPYLRLLAREELVKKELIK